MIYFFSGTGNSSWVAEQIGLKTGDSVVNITDGTGVNYIDNQRVGLVFPIYAWGAPEPVLEFVRNFKGNPTFTFAVCTCAGNAGNAMSKLSAIFPLNSTYSVIMPSNYVMGSDLESDEVVVSKITKAKKRINTIINQVISKQSINDVNKGKLPWIKSTLANFAFNKFGRTTKPFYVTDKCISCQQCARNCPASAIRMIDGKPQWSGKCYQCTSCINLCPERAIEYGKETSSRGRYQFKEV